MTCHTRVQGEGKGGSKPGDRFILTTTSAESAAMSAKSTECSDLETEVGLIVVIGGSGAA